MSDCIDRWINWLIDMIDRSLERKNREKRGGREWKTEEEREKRKQKRKQERICNDQWYMVVRKEGTGR